ncbi:hypothetical protein SUGI_0667800 [Cryptomeria japonica]|nr:hypothetical protein SUGI_0667800 [Cryptomeria japonica]
MIELSMRNSAARVPGNFALPEKASNKFWSRRCDFFSSISINFLWETFTIIITAPPRQHQSLNQNGLYLRYDEGGYGPPLVRGIGTLNPNYSLTEAKRLL